MMAWQRAFSAKGWALHDLGLDGTVEAGGLAGMDEMGYDDVVRVFCSHVLFLTDIFHLSLHFSSLW